MRAYFPSSLLVRMVRWVSIFELNRGKSVEIFFRNQTCPKCRRNCFRNQLRPIYMDFTETQCVVQRPIEMSNGAVDMRNVDSTETQCIVQRPIERSNEARFFLGLREFIYHTIRCLDDNQFRYLLFFIFIFFLLCHEVIMVILFLVFMLGTLAFLIYIRTPR